MEMAACKAKRDKLESSTHRHIDRIREKIRENQRRRDQPQVSNNELEWQENQQQLEASNDSLSSFLPHTFICESVMMLC